MKGKVGLAIFREFGFVREGILDEILEDSVEFELESEYFQQYRLDYCSKIAVERAFDEKVCDY